MIKHTVGLPRLRIVLFSAGIFISSAIGQTAPPDSGKIVNNKKSTAETTTTQPKGVVNSVAPVAAAAVDSSAKKDSVTTAVQRDSSTFKDSKTVVAKADSSVRVDSSVTPVASDSSSSKTVIVSTPVSADSVVKSDTVASMADSSTVQKDSAKVEKVAVPEATPFVDSSKTVADSAKAIKTEIVAADTQSSKPKTEEKGRKKDKKEKNYNTVGAGVMILAGTSGPEIGLIGSIHQFFHCSMPINIRGIFSYLPYRTEFDKTVSDQDLIININSKVSSADLLLDFHPLKNWLRISAGAFFSFTETKAKMQSKDGKSIGLITVTPEEMGTLEFTFSRNPVEPYLGLGIGNAVEKRVNFLMDLGVVYTGPLKVKGTGTGMIGPSSDNAKNMEKVFEKHNELFWWPVLSLGVGIKLF